MLNARTLMHMKSIVTLHGSYSYHTKWQKRDIRVFELHYEAIDFLLAFLFYSNFNFINQCGNLQNTVITKDKKKAVRLYLHTYNI